LAPIRLATQNAMRGNTRLLLAAILLCTAAIDPVQSHGRALQGQQALQLPHGFKIPNIFNTCEWQTVPCLSTSMWSHCAIINEQYAMIIQLAQCLRLILAVCACIAAARMLLPTIIPGQFVVTMRDNVTDLPHLLDR
jgi:hypothetical protein